MRILVLSAWDPVRPSDGASLVLFHHLRHLSDHHEIRVVTADREPAEVGASLPTCVPVERVPVRVPAALDGIARRVWAAVTGEPAHVRWVERPALRRRVHDLVRTWRPDVLWCFGWGTARLAALAPELPAVHTAVDPWRGNAEVRDLRGWRRWFDVGELDRIEAHERRHYPGLDAVVTVADADARSLRAMTGAHAVTVANGVEAGPPVVRPPTAPIIGLHGNFAARHNADAAEWALEQLLPSVRAHVPDATLHLIGRDPSPEMTAAQGRRGVVVTGAVPDVRRELDGVRVCVAPMRVGAGMKNKVLEAMAAGRPVVTTPLGTQGIDGGDGVVVTDLDGMAAAVVSLLRDPTGAEARGLAGRARVESSYSWTAAADRMAAVLQGARGRA